MAEVLNGGEFDGPPRAVLYEVHTINAGQPERQIRVILPHYQPVRMLGERAIQQVFGWQPSAS